MLHKISFSCAILHTCCAIYVYLHNYKTIQMATVKAFIRTSTKKTDTVKVRFRLTDGRRVQLFYASRLEVSPSAWDEKRQSIKAKIVYDSQQRAKFDKDLANIKQIIIEVYNQSDKEKLNSEQFALLIEKKLNPQKYKCQEEDFFSLMNEFLQKRKLSDVRERDFKVLIRALKRYEMLRSIIDSNEYFTKRNKDNKIFKLDINLINAETIEDIESFFRNEYILYNEYNEIYKTIPECRKPNKRGNNTICAMFRRLRAFFNWCNEQGKTDNKPFDRYEGVTSEKYGTPFYITIEERNKIADFDLSNRPSLEIQRDIFIFQCLIGCRVSDLLKMTNNNIINGVIEYIPHKTRDERPTVVRVPLNERALKLVEKYREADSNGRLFPFISSQKYNDAIKDVFKVCEITRMVTILNPTTGEEEKKPINEVASSHLARRTFIGNLYKKVKDPNLVGSLSGHAEGSKAFARYREIDDEIKTELVKMIE